MFSDKIALNDRQFAIPLVAEYSELEPVVTKCAQRPFIVPGIGPVIAAFGKIAIYGTEGSKIPVGVTFTAARPGQAPSHGTIWLNGRLVNDVDSQRITFADLGVIGVSDSTGTSLLIRLANARASPKRLPTRSNRVSATIIVNSAAGSIPP
ncbi:DUF4403 family protein [Sphingomonas nostoxanthinifaciens]|uniref:DUF4403 family protein n=1 Tax=Sphingomonas nostoxanthinifaciens TaxID=2872652 RepID=UPI001CC1DBD5|nr:DUF4403 family protein [Sphingomonas nostoxanthinifaciens]UAK25498.1 DUF4403 family protein [Sphingomonas nostoxanthinifaciens]